MVSNRLVKLNQKVLKLILSFSFLLCIQYANAQAIRFSEGFETDGEGTRYDSTWFNSSTDYFQRRPATDFTGLSNISGSGVLAARRINSSAAQNPTHPVGIFRSKPFDVSGYDDLTLSLDIAANVGVFDLGQDSLVIYYAFDSDIGASNFTKIGAFLPALAANSDLVEDDDLDGAPGPSTNALNGTLTNFSYNIPDIGNSLMIRILLVNSADNEIIVFDEMEVTGTPILALNGLTPLNSSLTNDLSSINIQYDQAISAGSSGSISINGPTSASRDIVTNITDFDFSTANEVTIDLSGTTFMDGAYSINVDAGIFQANPSGPNLAINGTSEWSFTLDATAPAAPIITGISDDTGSSNSDGVTSDQTLIINGTAEANSTVTLNLSGTGVLSNTIAVNGSGTWSFDYTGTTLSAGNFTLNATAMDQAGNVSPASPNFDIEVDTNINPPTISGITDDTGTNSNDGVTSDQTLILAGTAEPNSTVTLRLIGTGVLSSTISVDGSGDWSFDYTGTTLPQGNHAFRATAEDLAGNVSSFSSNFDVQIDNTISPPNITGISDDNGFSNTDGITNDQTLIFSGIAEPNSTVTLRLIGTGVLSNSINVDGSGDWAFDYSGTTLPPGNYAFRATAEDLAGNISSFSSNLDVQIITASLAAPVITSISDDTGSSNTDGITNDQTLIITGTAVPNTRVTLSLAGTGILSNSINVNGTGQWSFDYTGTTLPQGAATFTAITSDIAGNTSASSPNFDIEIDINAPAPVITAITNDTGISNSDQITNDQNLIISGTAEANSTLTLNLVGTGVLSSTIAVNGSGNWSFNYSSTTLPAGNYTFRASIIDLAGNVSSNSADFIVEIDISNPVAPTLLSIDNDTGTSSTDQNTNDQNIEISGTSEVNTVITLTLAGTGVVSNSIPVNASGNWSFDFSGTTLPNGTYIFTAFATDLAGNVGSVSSNFIVIIDITAPSNFITGNVVATSGTIRSNYWNATNDGLDITIPIANDISLAGGLIQIIASVNGAAFSNLGTTVSISNGSLGGNQVVSISSGVFEAFNSGILDTDTVMFNAVITDIAGNSTTGIESTSPIIIDQSSPIVRDSEFSLDTNDGGAEVITFTLNEELELPENATISGITTSTGNIASAIYSSKGILNLVTLTSSADGDWNQSTTVSYDNTTGNVLDIAGNEMGNFSGLPVEINVINLTAGDIAITSYRSDNPDAFSFVLLKDLIAGTEINFTDNGYRSDGAFSSDPGDRTITWSTSENLFAGSEIVITGLSASRGIVTGSSPLQHGSGGDQILAYQGSNSQPSFITGINWNGTDWVTSLTNNSESRSIVPPGLTDGVNALHMTDDDEDNGAYEFATEITAGTPDILRASLVDNTNWRLSDSPTNVTFPTDGDNYILPPNIEALLPTNGSRIAADFSAFQIDFDENVNKSAVFGGEIAFVESGGGVISSLDITSTNITVTNDKVNINISSILPLLSDETSYEVNVDGFLFSNGEGNHNDSIIGSTDWTFIYDRTPPQVSSINRRSGSNNPEIDDNGVTFTVTFDDNVTGVDVSDFAVVGNASTVATVSAVRQITGAVYEVDITGIDLNNNLLSGVLSLNLIDNNSILDNASNPLGGNGIQNFNAGQTFTIIHPTPAAHVTNFNVDALATTSQSITLQWTESSLEQLPNRYLILVREASSSFITVNNGTLYNDADLSDGQGAFNLARGNNSIQIPGLVSGTSYFFRIIPHTNDGSNIRYRTNATIPETSATTLVAQLSTLNFVSAASEIQATINNQTDIVGLDANLAFTIQDDGGISPDPDNAPTLISQINFTPGANNNNNISDWTTIIAGAELRDSDGNTSAGTVSATSLVFNLINGDEEIGEIDDNETKGYQLRIWLNSNLNTTLRDIVDGLNFEFSLSQTEISVEPLGSSGIALGARVSSGRGNNEIIVNANRFLFTSTPASIEGINQPLNQNSIIEIRDVNNNLDLNYAGSFNLSTPLGGANFNNPTDNFNGDGQLSLLTFRYVTPGAGDLTISDPANILSSASTGSIDVIHTVFLNMISGLSDNPLQPADGERAIFGFGVASSTQTPGAPIFPGFTVRFDRDFIDTYQNFRVFRSSDNNFDLLSDNVITNANTPGFSLSENNNNITVSGLNTILTNTPQYYFIVVDVSTAVSQSTPSITATMSTGDIAIPSSSGSISNFSFNGPSFIFLDQRPPEVLSLIPEGDNASIDSDLIIVFDEPVQSSSRTVTVFTANDDVLAGTAILSSVITGFNDTLIFEFPGQFEPDREYYVRIEEGDINDDTSNEFSGFLNNTDWRFRTADSDPPVFQNTSPQENFVFSAGFDIRINIDEPGVAYYMVFESPNPMAGQIPMVNELIDNTYTGTAPIVYDSIIINQGLKDFFAPITNLTPGSSYNIFVVARDLANNRQASVTSFNVSLPSSDSPGILLSNPTISVCSGDFQNIAEPIHILEGSGSSGRFASGANQTIDLALPSGFEFYTGNDSPPTVDYFTTGDISAAPTIEVINSGLARITFSVSSGDVGIDRMTIANLRIRAADDALSGDLIKFSGNATNIPDNAILAQFELAPPIPVNFEFGTGTDAVGNNLLQVSLIPDPSIADEGINTFSGNGVQGETFFTFLAGIGTHTITLVHETDFGCISSNERDITVFDNSDVVDGIESNYCTNDLSEITIVGPSNQTIGSNIFNLINLQVDPLLSNIGDINEVTLDETNAPSIWTLNFGNVGTGQVAFRAVFQNRSDPSVIIIRTQIVTISDPPEISLELVNNFGPNGDGENFCEGDGNIEIQGTIDNFNPDFEYIQSVQLDIDNDGRADILPSGTLIDNMDGTAEIIMDLLAEIDSVNDNPINIFDMPIAIMYTVENVSTSCEIIEIINIDIHAKPEAEFNTNLGCVGIPVSFDNVSNVDSTSKITSYQWNFDDAESTNNTPTDSIPTHEFLVAGIYDVTLEVKSDSLCTSDLFTRSISIGNNPEVEYTFGQIGIDLPTEFIADISNVSPDDISGVVWTFDGIPSDTITSDFDSPFNFQFNDEGIHDVILTATTDNLCVDSIADSMFTVRVEEVTSDMNYDANFNNGDNDGWIGSGVNSSWGVGTSGGNTITEGFDGTGDRFWTTGVDTTYNNQENSFVYSPIFDLSEMERPLIVLNTFNHTSEQNDGVVLQYLTTEFNGSSDSNSDSNDDWTVVGSIGTGINWYNTGNIRNAPGDQTFNRVGWSLEDSLWRESRHALNGLNVDRIQFRVAFRSGDNSSVDSLDGFAFDNVVISERSRNVLVENFRNTSPNDNITLRESNFLDTLFSNSNADFEFIKINYQTDFPGFDPINQINPVDPSARAVYYNIQETPRAVIDGNITNDDLFTNWGEDSLLLRALSSAPYDIQVSTSAAENGALNISAEITPKLVRGENLLIFAAILEKEITLNELASRGVDITEINTGESTFNFVLRTLLPNAAGFNISTENLQPGVPLPNFEQSWIPNNIELEDMAVVVFIQDADTREIYQAEMLDVTDIPSPITSLENLSSGAIGIFPNPANDQVTVTFNSDIRESFNIRIYNNYGQLIDERQVNTGTRQILINTEQYTPGLYHMQLFQNEDELEIKRLVIAH